MDDLQAAQEVVRAAQEKVRAEQEQRAQAAWKAIQAVLVEYRCTIGAEPMIVEGRITTRIQILAAQE